MAISVAAGVFLQHVGSAPNNNGAWSAFGWSKYLVTPGMTCILALSNSAAIANNYDYFGTNTTDMVGRLSSNVAGDHTNGVIPDNEWFWWGVRHTAADGDLEVLINGVELFSVACDTTGRATAADRFEYGHVQGALQAELGGAYMRFWDGAALTDEEFTAETYSTTPVRTADIFARFQYAEDALLVDSSGNGRHWSAPFGGATFVADPDLPEPPAAGYDLAGSASFALTAAAMELKYGYPLAGSAAFALTAGDMRLAYSTGGRKLMILRS